MAVIGLVVDRDVVDLGHDPLGPERIVDLLPAVNVHNEEVIG